MRAPFFVVHGFRFYLYDVPIMKTRYSSARICPKMHSRLFVVRNAVAILENQLLALRPRGALRSAARLERDRRRLTGRTRPGLGRDVGLGIPRSREQAADA
jgi:hypothetical protein